ncbi:MAG: DUF1553 domain-containing protein, partial [Pirellulales bacterium]|nr:DUF1553 domain-containing protein [Pirellulales bacterium]
EEKLKEVREAIKESERNDKAEPPPRPDFRPRTKLVDLALADDRQQFFAKNLVNRVWARLLGRGLVHPLDQMHSENPPSHPELINELSQDVMRSGYDVKRLIHAIVLSETYARQPAGLSESRTPPELFAAALPRPLTPHQLSLSCAVATASPRELPGTTDLETWQPKRAELEKRSEGHARRFAIPADGFQVSVEEALWFSNNPSAANDFLNGSRQKLVGYLKEFDSAAEVSYRVCRSILSRPPDAQQHALITEYIETRADRREEAIRQVVWALLSSSEFRFNH